MGAWLIGMSSQVKGRRFDIDQDEVIVGRTSDNQIAIEDASVSSRHCQITRSDRKYTVRDLNSTNGTRVNGTIISQTGLKPKDIVQLGVVELMFDGEDVDVSEWNQPLTTRIEVSSESMATPMTFKSASPFGARRERRKIWVVLIVLVGLAALAALVMFFIKLLQ